MGRHREDIGDACFKHCDDRTRLAEPAPGPKSADRRPALRVLRTDPDWHSDSLRETAGKHSGQRSDAPGPAVL